MPSSAATTASRSAAAAARSRPSGMASRGSCAWVSGSPNRTLNSSRRGPSAVSMRPANSAPRNGLPRRASSATTGRWNVRTISAVIAASRSGSGETAPIPPVFGPRSPSPSRLWSRAAGSARQVVASQMAMTDASGPVSASSTTRHRPAAPKTPSIRAARMAASAVAGSAQTVTPLPAARPSAFTATRPPSSCAKAIAAIGSSNARPRAIGTPAASATSRQNALLPSSRAAAALGPKAAMSSDSQPVHDPPDERGLRTDHHQVHVVLPGRGGDGHRVHGGDGGQHGRDIGHARVAGRHEDRIDAGFAGEPPGEGMLAAAAADHEDPAHRFRPPVAAPGRARAHPGRRPRARSSGYARGRRSRG